MKNNNALALTTTLNDFPISSLSPSATQILTDGGCQAPLLQVSNKTDAHICLDECCLACPYLNNFYKENLIDYTYKTFSGFGIISFFLMILLSIGFLVLPSQRQNPITKQILLPFTLSIAYFEASQFFIINQKQTLCLSDSLTTTVHNSSSCKFQAIFSLGGAYAMGYWSAILMTHLHMLSIWRSEFIMRNIYYFHGLAWSATLLSIIVPFLTNNVTLRANWRRSDQTQYTSRTSISEAQRAIIHVKYVINVQWRALMGAFMMLIVYVFAWVFFSSGTLSLRDENDNTVKDWVIQWMNCTQNPSYYDYECNSISKPHVQPYALIMFALFFNGCIGILMFIVFAAKKSIILEAWKIIKGYKSIACSHSGEEIGSIGTSSINFRRSVVSENVSSFEDDKKSVKITLKEWFNNLYNKYLKCNDLASKNKFKELGNSISNNNNNNNHVGGHTTIVIGKIRDFSHMMGRKDSISSGVGSGQALGYNSYNDNEESTSRNIHNNNVNNSIKKPHSRDSSSRLSIKRNKHDKSSSDSLSLHMSTPEMARASFGLGNNSLSSVSSISTSNRRSDGSDDGDTNNLPSSSSSKQVSNTITIPDNDDDTKDLQIQDAESTMLEFHTSTSTFLEFHTSTSTFLEFHTSTSSFNDNNDMKDTDSSNVNLVRTETFGSDEKKE
nr:5189_t:CDS:2 [Entrophospora candida]